MSRINKVTLNPNDIVIFHVDLSNLPPTKANDYIKGTNDAAKSKFPEHVVMVLPSKTSMTIINKVQ
jgi:hypothetical protein